MSARENLLQQLRLANREYVLAKEQRRRAKRALREAEDRVAEARRHLRLVEHAIPADPGDGPQCPQCLQPVGSNPHCMECQVLRVMVIQPRDPSCSGA